MTPWEAFKQELEKSGHALCRCPRDYVADLHELNAALSALVNMPPPSLHAEPGNAIVEHKKNVVHMGHGHDHVRAGIAGLHELGHAALGHGGGPRSCLKVLEDERAAWDWTAARMPPGWEGMFGEFRAACLKTYEDHLCLRCRARLGKEGQ
jgi:hypothetical protein